MKCIFCEKLLQEKPIVENDLASVYYDQFPVSPGHALIIPKKHSETFFDTSEEERMCMLKLLDEIKTIIDEEYSPLGYNIGLNCGEVSGQTVMHTHMHLIPRYKNDQEDPRGGVRGVIKEKQKY